MIEKCIVAAGSQVATWAENEGLTQHFEPRRDKQQHHCSAYSNALVGLHGFKNRPVCDTHLAAWRKNEPSLQVEITDYVIEEALL